MCQFITMRQFLRSTLLPCWAADSSAKLHWVGSERIPAFVIEPIERTPASCLPASVMPDGVRIEATANSIFSCNGFSWSLASRSVNHSDS